MSDDRLPREHGFAPGHAGALVSWPALSLEGRSQLRRHRQGLSLSVPPAFLDGAVGAGAASSNLQVFPGPTPRTLASRVRRATHPSYRLPEGGTGGREGLRSTSLVRRAAVASASGSRNRVTAAHTA